MTIPIAEPLRIGVLGAARISELSIVIPARLTGARLVAVAARDRSRAADFAAKNDVERVLDSYADVINDPAVEVVYNSLANSLHAPWNLRAITAGKHVLTEKPFAGNASEAHEVAAQARAAGVLVFEGFHYLFHPVIARLHDIIAAGELGEIRRVETVMDMPAPAATDPRWSFQLAGGAMMDLGCYSLHSQRALARFCGGEPAFVAATGGERAGAPGVDEWLSADLVFPNGAAGAASCNMAAAEVDMHHRVIGSAGEATVPDFIHPHLDDRLIIRTAAGTRTENLGTRSSYTYQLDALTAAIRTGSPIRTDPADSVRTMQLIDDCYTAIGFPLRTS